MANFADLTVGDEVTITGTITSLTEKATHFDQVGFKFSVKGNPDSELYDYREIKVNADQVDLVEE